MSVSSSREKHESALRTIGEVSVELDLPQHVLRFWEGKIKLIKPMKQRGRRYYRSKDVEVIQRIKELLYTQGYTIRGVQNLVAEGRLFDPTAPANTNAAEDLPSSGMTLDRARLSRVLQTLKALRDKLTETLPRR